LTGPSGCAKRWPSRPLLQSPAPPWPALSSFRLHAISGLPRTASTLSGYRNPILGCYRVRAALKSWHAPSGRQRRLAHILLGAPVSPQEAARQGLVHRTVNGKAIDGALEIARRLAALPKESLAYIKRLVRNATETPLEKGLALERNLFMRLCITDEAVARMRSYEGLNITSPARSIEVGPEFRS